MNEIQYWTDIKSEEEMKFKIISHSEFDNRTENDVKLILEYLQPNKNDEIIFDFGCGTGRLIRPLSPYCKNLLGVDISEVILDSAIKKCGDLKNVIFKPLQNDSLINLENNSIDKIYSFLVLQHIEKSKVFNILTEFNRILIMKGKVFLQFPSLLKGKNVFHQSLITKNQLRSLTPRLEFYLKEELEILFEFAGIKILEIIEEETDFYVLGEKEKEIKKLNIVLRSPFKNEK